MGGRLASVSEMPARPLWPGDDPCQSDLGGTEPSKPLHMGAPWFLQDARGESWFTWFLDPDLDLRDVGMNPSTCPK